MRIFSILLILALGLTSPEAQAQVPSSDWQIAAAELALPPALRADATVMGHVGDLDGELTELRAGDNGLICDVRAGGDDDARLGVWCGPQVMRDYVMRADELRESGVDYDARAEILRAELESGDLADPTGTVSYAFRGAEGSFGADLVALETEGRQWQIVVMPFTSADALGVATEPMGSMPWMMAAGGPFSHLMVYGDPASQKTAPRAAWTLPLSTESVLARRHFLKGVHAYYMGRISDADEAFEQAIAADEDFALAHFYRAYSGQGLDSWRDNIERAAAAAESGASDEEKLLVESGVKALSFDIVARRATLEALVQMAPESPIARIELARVQTQMGEYDAARASLTQAIETAPEMAAAHIELGRSYILGEPRDAQAAIRHMTHAVEHAPHEAFAHDALGDAYRASGDLELAREAYAASSRYPGLSGRAYTKLGHVHSFLGDFDAARASYDRASAIDRANGGQDNAALFRALVHLHAGEPQAAIDRLVAVAADLDGPDPLNGNIAMHMSALDIALHHGMVDRAQTLLTALRPLANERAERLGNDDGRRWTASWLTSLEGRIALADGRLDAAATKADAVAEMVADFTDPNRMQPVHALHGRIALARGDAAAAAEHLRQADLERMDVKYHLAQALEASGETAQAAALYAEVAGYNFNGVDYALVRSDALAKAAQNM